MIFYNNYVNILSFAKTIGFSEQHLGTVSSKSNMVIMNQTIKSLHRYCSIGPQLGLALLALMYDTRAWYDTVAAFAILFSISSIIICNNLELSYRGFLHTICVVVGVIGYDSISKN